MPVLRSRDLQLVGQRQHMHHLRRRHLLQQQYFRRLRFMPRQFRLCRGRFGVHPLPWVLQQWRCDGGLLNLRVQPAHDLCPVYSHRCDGVLWRRHVLGA